MSSSLITFSNSILQNSSEPLDYYAPVSFAVWLEQKNSGGLSVDELFKNYNNYIVAWGKYKKRTDIETNTILKDSYIQVLKDLVINYSTEEEKRFITNADFSDPYDLDVVLNFFVNKLKVVCNFYSDQRELLKTSTIQHNLKGSNLGISTFVKKAIFDIINTNQLDFTETDINVSFPPLSSVAQNINVYVEELYDTYSNYYNVNPQGENFDTPDTSNLRRELSSVNVAGLNDPYLYLNLKESIKNAILQYNFYVDSLGVNNFVINPVLSGTELQYLKERDFIEYLSGGTEELKLNLIKRINPKYLVNDFYYLSTGSTRTSHVSGLLFTVAPLTGAPTLNLLNRHYPTTATVPNLSALYSAVELGRFFLPQFTGLLIHNTPDKSFYINSEKLEPNTLYAFPDPRLIGNVSYGSKSDNLFCPFVYKIDVSWNKVSRSNNFRFAEVLSNSYNPLYFGYQSETQDLQADYEGLSRSSDNIQFWEGEFQDIWSNNTWPGLDKVEELPLAQRQASLLTGEQSLVQWSCDKFGNEYGLYKNVFALKTPAPLTARNISSPAGQTSYVSYEPLTDTKIFQRKNTIPGNLYFKDISTSRVLPASAALSGIFIKYPPQVREQFLNNLIKFNVYESTFVAETRDYVIVDTVDYSYETGNIINTNIPSNYISKSLAERRLEKYLGNWYAENEKAIYIGFLRLLPYLSASNYRALYPAIYKTRIPSIKFVKVYPDDSLDLFKIYSLSSNETDIPEIDLFDVTGFHFSKVEKNNLFNITYQAKNRNGMPYFVNEQLLKAEPYLKSNLPKLFKPFYYNLDNNYANEALPFYVKYNSSYSRAVGTHNNVDRIFDVGEKDTNYVVYQFKDDVEPVQINNLGTYIIQFDWETYNSTNLFIGCNLFNVRNIDNNIIWNNQYILSAYNEKILVDTFQALDSYIPSPSGTQNRISIIEGTTTYSINIGDDTIHLSNLTSYLSSYFIYNNGNIETDYGNILVSIDDSSNFYSVISSNNLNSIKISPNALDNVIAGSTLTFYASTAFLPVYSLISAFVRRPVFPDPGVLELSFTTSISTFTGVFCDAPNSIFKTVEIIRSGDGTGIVFMDPFCIDCPNICSDIFALGTTVSIIASASYFSIFNGWESYVCEGTDDCTFTVSDNTSITAVFDPAPTRFLRVDPGIGTTISTDGLIYASGGNVVERIYKIDTVIYLSSSPAPSGFFFTGYKGNPCNFGPIDRRDWCLFTMFDNFSISATYVPIQLFDINLDVVNVYENYWGVPFGRVVSIPEGINCFGEGYITDTGSCSGTFIGGPQYPLFTYLSAVPEKGWRFKRWVGNILDNKFDNPVQFNLTGNIAVSAEFDLGFFRVDTVTIGSGLCRTITTNPIGIDCTTSLIDEERGKAGCFIDVLSGTEITVFSFGLPGNTVTALYGPDGNSVVVQPLVFRATDNVTISAEVLSGEAVLLTVQNNLSSCYFINSIPGNMTVAPDTVSGFQRKVKFFPKSATVTVTVTPSGNSTTCLPFSGFYGDNISYLFGPGGGIRMTSPVNILSAGDRFNLTNASISISPGGAPFIAGPGIILNQGDVNVYLTDNITITALSL